MSSSKFLEMMERGKTLALKKDYRGAAKAFSEALQLENDISALNNLANAFFLNGEIDRAWALIEPRLDPAAFDANPYTFALAAQLSVHLGRPEAAREQLKEAAAIFEQKIPLLDRLGLVKEAWYEYTVQMMRAAAALQDHRLVLDLYRRWEKYHVNWENPFLAGIAAFNIGRFSRASSLWERISHVAKFVVMMQQVAFLVDRGLIPPFPLEYELFDPERLMELAREPENEAVQSRYLTRGNVRMALLSYLFSPDLPEDQVKGILRSLIKFGEDWGKEFGLNLLEAGGVPRELKYFAALALVERGVYEAGQPIPVVIDGREEQIKIQEFKIALEPDPELDRLNKRAVTFRDRGKIDEALALVEPLYEQGRYYLPTMITLANLYRWKNKPELAREIFELLEQALPGAPVVLINLAGVNLELHEYRAALDCLDRIDAELNREMEEKARIIRNLAERRLSLNEPYKKHAATIAFEDTLREEIEKKKIPLQATLKRGLQNMPNEWLLNLSDHLDLDCRQRRDREDQIAARLVNQKVLAGVIEELGQEETELLRYLLQQGGWARLNAVTRKFGRMAGDGFYWDEEDPVSPLGFLWSRALVFVGRAVIDNRNTKVAVVPIELREKLMKLLNVSLAAPARKDKSEPGARGARDFAPAEADKEVLSFRVTMTDYSGKVRGYPFRTLAVPANFTLYRLARAILDAFGFDDDHAFGFYDNIKHWTLSREGYELFADIGKKQSFPGLKKTGVAKAFPVLKKKMLFLYDYGDEWRFIVQLKRIEKARPGQTYPAVLEQFDPED